MRQPSGKTLVLAKYPDARIETQRQQIGKTYYLIRRWPGGSPPQDWSGCGDTPAQAWNDAADRMGLRS